MLSPSALEEAVVAVLSHSERACEVAAKLNGFRLFHNPTYRRIAEVSLDYVAKYSQPPKAALNYLLEADMQRGEQGRLIVQELERIPTIVKDVDTGFVIEQLDFFIESQRLITALQQSLELAQEGELGKAKEKLVVVSDHSKNGDAGLWMKDANQALSFLDRDEETEFFSSGISLLDDREIRPERQTMMFMIAATGKGKTWFLVNIGKSSLQHHKKVLHITLELSAKKTARRYLQSIFGLTKGDIQLVRSPVFLKDPNGGTTIDFVELQRDSIFNKRMEIRQKLEKWTSCPQWHIKQFPTGTLSSEQLYMYIESLEQREGFKPDVLILDYADIMRINADSLRIDTGRLYKDLRALAVEKNLALVSATQGNRESETAKLVGTTNVAEDWSKIGTADVVLTYSQTPSEKQLGLARIFVGKARDTSDHFIALIGQSYDTGIFCTDSVAMNTELATQLQSL